MLTILNCHQPVQGLLLVDFCLLREAAADPCSRSSAGEIGRVETLNERRPNSKPVSSIKSSSITHAPCTVCTYSIGPGDDIQSVCDGWLACSEVRVGSLEIASSFYTADAPLLQPVLSWQAPHGWCLCVLLSSFCSGFSWSTSSAVNAGFGARCGFGNTLIVSSRGLAFSPKTLSGISSIASVA